MGNTKKRHRILRSEIRKKKSNGFTLIELLVAMSIVSILAAAIWGNFFTSIIKGRDSRRKQDLESIAKALDLYYSDNRAYPTAFVTPGNAFTHPVVTGVVYMQKVPGDPAANQTYCYPTTAAGASFQIYAKLENRQDPKIIPTITCGSDTYNYGISSPNTSP